MRNPLDLGLTLSDRFSRCDHRSYKAATEVVRVLPSVPVKLDLLPGGHLFDVDIIFESCHLRVVKAILRTHHPHRFQWNIPSEYPIICGLRKQIVTIMSAFNRGLEWHLSDRAPESGQTGRDGVEVACRWPLGS